MSSLRAFALVLALGTLSVLGDAHAAEPENTPNDVVHHAVEAVASGAYDDAVNQLEALADSGFLHPDASYARAYAYVERARSRARRPGDLGRALAALEETRLLRPTADVEPAMDVLRSEISRQRAREGNTDLVQRPALGRAVSALLEENAWAGLAIFGSALVSVGLALYLFVKRRSAEIGGATALVVGLVLGALGAGFAATARHYRLSSKPAVIVVPEARLLDANGHALQTTAKAPRSVPEGALVYVHEQRESYSHIEWGTLEGWVEASQAQLLQTAPAR